MKKKALSVITLAAVLLFGVVIGVSASAASVPAAIKSAVYSSAKVYFYGEQVPLKDSLVLITAGNDKYGKLYMPVNELLEYMNFQVEWNKQDNAVYLTMNSSNDTEENLDSLTQNESDTKALDLMQRTGNWSYIEPYLPYMSHKGIDAVVASYNSKHMKSSEHKQASDYYN